MELTSFAPDYSVVELMNKESLVFFGPEKAEKERWLYVTVFPRK